MLTRLKNWWNRDSVQPNKEIEEMKQRLQELEDARHKDEQELQFHRTKAASDEAKRNGTEPWVEIKSERIDPIKGLQLELDWNEAFIQHLKDSGLQGRDEDTLVQRWLALLTHKLVESLEQRSIDQTAIRGTEDDFK